MIAFVLDVESIGLHGEGFAFGYVVVDLADGRRLEQGLCTSEPVWSGIGEEFNDYAWVLQNVPPTARLPMLANSREVRQRFWEIWMHWKSRGALLFADCSWPVEARFLRDCVADQAGRMLDGPYPLHEIATLAWAVGVDPVICQARLADELPAHDPLNDARQSARMLVQFCKRIEAR